MHYMKQEKAKKSLVFKNKKLPHFVINPLEYYISFKIIFKNMRLFLFSIFAFLVFYAGSCNSEHIDGYIEYDNNSISVNDSLHLKAIVTSNLEPKKVIWEYTPQNSFSSIISPVPSDPSGGKYNAIFTSSEPGEYKIYLRFFYRNTAPKDSDTITVKVVE